LELGKSSPARTLTAASRSSTSTRFRLPPAAPRTTSSDRAGKRGSPGRRVSRWGLVCYAEWGNRSNRDTARLPVSVGLRVQRADPGGAHEVQRIQDRRSGDLSFATPRSSGRNTPPKHASAKTPRPPSSRSTASPVDLRAFMTRWRRTFRVAHPSIRAISRKVYLRRGTTA